MAQHCKLELSESEDWYKEVKTELERLWDEGDCWTELPEEYCGEWCGHYGEAYVLDNKEMRKNTILNKATISDSDELPLCSCGIELHTDRSGDKIAQIYVVA